MEPCLRCPNGHEWIPAGAPPSGESAAVPRCPECGEPGLPPPAPADDPALDATREIDPRLKSPRVSSPPAPAGPKVYPRIAGYEILDELGRGGMGVVYRARQTTLNRIVALKMVLAGEHASDRARARFLGEAEIAAGLQHANIIQIHELGEDDGLPYIAMEYVAGGGMAAWMEENRGDFQAVALFFEKIARAADWAHQRSVVHRDLKPANVFLAEDGEPKIGDFGLAKRLDDDGSGPRLTLSGEKMGTPHYMAPEQAYHDFGPVGPGTDVYALGVMLFETLAGKVPLSGPSEMEMLHRLRVDDPPSPSRHNPDVPRDLETICLKCLRKHPRDRYFTAGALADDLRRFRTGEPVLAKPLTAVTRSFRWVRRHRTGLALTSLLSALVIATGAWALHGYLYRWEHAAVYRNFTKLYGEYHGLGDPLPDSEIAQRLLSYRIVRSGRKGHTRRLECIDSLGRLTYHSGYQGPLLQLVPNIFESLPSYRQPVVFELSYSQRNLPAEESLRDLTGRLVARIRYAYPEDYARGGPPGAKVRADYVDEESRPIATPAGISSALLVRDARGREQLLAYSDQEQRMKTDLTGVSILRFEFDDSRSGRPIALVNLDQNERITNNTQGWASLRFEWHDEESPPHTVSYFLDAEGRPVANDGVHRIRNDLDAHGNLVAVTRFGLDGETPARLATGLGATHETITYDAQFRRATWTFSGFDPEKAGAFREIDRYEWKADGSHLVTSTFEDEEGKPVRWHGRYRTLATRYNTVGQALEITRDDYASSAYPYAREVETMAYTPDGHVTRRTIAYQAKGGGLAFHSDGNSLYVQEFDAKGRLERVTLGGMDPTRESYDQAVTETEWPRREEDGVAYWNLGASLTDATQAGGQASQISASGTAASARPTSWSTARRESIAFGDRKEFPLRRTGRYLDAEGKAVRCRNGNTGWTREFDERGRPATERLTGFDEAIAGYASSLIVYRYANDEAETAESTLWTFLDAEGKPRRHPDGYLEYIDEFDGDGKSTATITRSFDPEREGLFAKRLVYESKPDGSVVAIESYTDAGGNPARHPSGYLRFEQTSDTRGRVLSVEQIGFDPAEHGYERVHIRFVYGDSGKETRWVRTWFDAAGQRVPGDTGATGRVDEFDEQGRNVAIRSTGFDPAKFPYATELKTTRWAEGKRKEAETWTYLDAEERPVRHPDGYLRFEITYDDQARALRFRESGFDADALGYDTQIRDFAYWEGETRRSIHWHYEDAEGQPVRFDDGSLPGGYFEYTDEFGTDGEAVATVLSGFDPAVTPFFRQRQAIAPHSTRPEARILTTTYEDAEGKPARGFAGELRTIQIDASGILASLMRDGIDASEYGFSRMTAGFDAQGRLESVTFTDADGKAVAGVHAYLFHVVPGSPGDKAGLRAGDYLLTQNGEPITSAQAFLRKPVAGERTFEVLRDGKTLTLSGVPAGTLGIFPADRVPPQ